MFKQIYVYLVLFATLMLTISGGIGIFNGVADYLSPSTYIQSYSEYKTMMESGDYKENDTRSDTSNQDNEIEDIKKDYQQYVNDETERAKKHAINMIIKSIGFIIVPLPVFFYFNKRRKQVE